MPCANDAQWQAASNNRLCTSTFASDNVDDGETMKQRLYYKIEKATSSGGRAAMCDMNGADAVDVDGQTWWSYQQYVDHTLDTTTINNVYPGTTQQIFPFNKCSDQSSADDTSCPCALRGMT